MFFGRRLADAAVLLAALVVPLYFVAPADNAFEPPKAFLLRLLGALALFGLYLDRERTLALLDPAIARLLPGLPGRNPDSAPEAHTSPAASTSAGAWSRRLLTVLLLVWMAALVSTLLSIAPWTSLLGSQARAAGLATDTALLALALAAAKLALHPRGATRLATMIGASVLPAAMYGILQRFRLDPLPWAGDVAERVVGPAGASPLFAAHLVMALPFAAWLALRAWERADEAGVNLSAGDETAPHSARTDEGAEIAGDRHGSEPGLKGRVVSPGQVRLALWLTTVLLGTVALLMSSSRGPLLGLACGCGVALLVQAAGRGDRRLAALVVGLAAGGLACLIALNVLATGPLAPLAKLPVLNRMSEMLNPERGTTRVRLRLWEGSAAAAEWTQRNRLGRFAIGYGPETMDRMWAPFYPSILAYDEARGQVPDRAHNLVADLVLTEGALGLVLTLTLFAVAMMTALAMRLGFPSGRAWLWISFSWLLAGGLAASLVAALDHSRRLSGPAFGLGALAAVVAWLVAVAWRGRGPVDSASGSRAGWERPVLAESPELRGLVLAGVVAIAAHWIDLQFSFGVTSSRLVLALLAGMWVGLASRSASGEAEDRPDLAGPAALESAPEPSPSSDLWLAIAGLGAVLVADFAHFGLVGGGGEVAALLVIAAVVGVGLLVLTTAIPAMEAVRPASFVRPWAGLAAFTVIHLLLRRAGWQGEAEAWPSVAATVTWLGLWIMALCVFLAAGMVRVEGHANDPLPLPVGRLAAGLLAVAAFGWFAGAAPVLADVAAKEGERGWQQQVSGLRAAEQSGRAESFLDRARDRYALARRLAPWEPNFRLALAREEVERGDLLTDRLERTLAQADIRDVTDEYAPDLLGGEGAAQARARDAAFAAGVAAAESAKGLAPNGAGPLPLVTRARAWRVWADRTRQASAKAERLAKAAGAYDEAIAAAVHWPELYDEAALTALLAGQPAVALRYTSEAVAVDPFYLRAWRTAAAAHALQDDAAGALEAYARYFEDYRNAGDLPALRGKLAALGALGRTSEALAAAETIAKLAPEDAHAEADLAALLDAAGRPTEALTAARRAAELDPKDSAIAALVARLAEKVEGGSR